MSGLCCIQGSSRYIRGVDMPSSLVAFEVINPVGLVGTKVAGMSRSPAALFEAVLLEAGGPGVTTATVSAYMSP